jgi:ABC-2 type transport system permease protein
VCGTLFAAAELGGKVEIGPLQYAGLAAVDILGVLPFCALGFYIGALASGEGAQALINIVYLPMAVLSGLWVPLESLPPVLSAIAPIWPSYHLAQLALHVVGIDDGAILPHIVVPVAVTLVFFGLARRRLARMNMR